MSNKNKAIKVGTHKCIICGKTFKGYGNDPWPIVLEEDCKEGEECVCCDKCNLEVVVPKRVSQLTVQRKK